jgi:RNA polymerase sigma-70 factor, ECF subfamily
LTILATHIDANNAELTEKRQQVLEQESQWILAAQQDLRHFEPLYKKYYQPIYEFVYRRCDDAESCLDITSLIFEKAMLNIGKFKIQGFPFGSWLYRIASSEIGNYYRKQKKERKVWVRTDGLQDMAQELESKYDDEENVQILLKAMECLKPEEIELIVMRYFEKRSFGEIANITDSTESNARVKTHRTMQRLREFFNKEEQK